MNGAGNEERGKPKVTGVSVRNPRCRAVRARVRGVLAALVLAAATIPGAADAQTRATVTVAATLPTTQIEGGRLSFEVERTGTPIDQALDVSVQVSETGAMLPAFAKGHRIVTIPEYGQVGHLTIDSVADPTDEADSTVTVHVIARSRYRPGTPSRAQATVTDDDLPVVSVAAVAGSVREGGRAVFRISRAGLTARALAVDLPTVSVEAGLDPVDEGTPARFTVTRIALTASARW